MFKDTDNLICEETFNDNYIVYTDMVDKKKYYMKEFMDYKLNNIKHQIKFTIVDINTTHKRGFKYKQDFTFKQNIDYYEKNTEFYIEIFLDFLNKYEEGHMDLFLYINNHLYDSISFKYQYNNVNEINDLIRIQGECAYYYLYLSKDTKQNRFYIHKIIFEKK